MSREMELYVHRWLKMDILSKLQKYTDYSLGISKEKLEIKYEDTRFDNLNFSDFDMNNTFFLEVEFIKCDFSGVYLSGSNLSGSVFEKCIFNKIYLEKDKQTIQFSMLLIYQS